MKPLGGRYFVSIRCAMVGVAIMLGSSWACQQHLALQKVPDPEDFALHEVGVQRQFEAIRQRMDRTSKESPNVQAEAWGHLGHWYFAYKYPSRAQKCYANAQKLDPSHPQWPFFLGVLHMEKGQEVQARELFQQARALDPTAVEPALRLAELAVNAQDEAAAESYYRSVLSTVPDQPEALLGLGSLKLSKGELSEGIGALEKLLSQQPDVSQAHYLLGTAYAQLGDSEKASFHFAKVPEENTLHVKAKWPDAWMDTVYSMLQGSRDLSRRGFKAFRQGEFGAAARWMEKAVASNPDNADMRVNYAVSLEKFGYLRHALNQAELALVQDPENVRGHLFLGKMSLEQGQKERAEKHLLKVIALDPGSAEGMIQLGRLRHHQQRLDEAIAWYGRARNLNRALESTRFWHAALLVQAGRDAEAETALAQDLSIVPEYYQLRLLRIRLLATSKNSAIRNPSQARSELENLQVPVTPFLTETWAMVAASQGDYAKAALFQEAALSSYEAGDKRKIRQIARRRLALYRSKEPCGLGWEEGEHPVLSEIQLTQLEDRP